MSQRSSTESSGQGASGAGGGERPSGGGVPTADSSIGIVPFRSAREERRRWGSRPPAGAALPERYEVRAAEGDDGAPVLRCLEAPGVAVTVDRSLGLSEAEARKLGERVILLDGAGQFGPTLDENRQLYNLDHHSGCLRAFTLATCEQALILVLKGLELDRGDWRILANEPDLDTLFAIWVLLNYRRLKELSPPARDSILPLLRLEGAIDANGYEIAEFCGLPQQLVAEHRARLDALHRRELELKKSGDWGRQETTAYVAEMLGRIDRLVYRPDDFEGLEQVEEEYCHVSVGENKVAVVCRDSSGIYEVEQRLKRRWGNRLGIVALEKEPGQYTLRRTAALAGIDLDAAYYQLNLFDPRVDGRPPEKRWGGSDDIGGSPRPTGTGLRPKDVGEILWLAYRESTTLSRLKHVGLAVLAGIGLGLLAAVLLLAAYAFLLPAAAGPEGRAAVLAATAGVCAIVAVVLSRQLVGRRRWLVGWRRWAGRDWWPLAPLALLLVAAGGAWPAPPAGGWQSSALAAMAGGLLLAALAVELWLRGLAHGVLIFDFPVQTVGSRWRLSVPAAVAATLHALLALAGWSAGILTLPWELPAPLAAAAIAGLGLAAGLVLGLIRERSGSILPGVLFLALGWAARLVLATLM